MLSDAQHPATNFFNSRISRDGALFTDRNPAYANTLGMDASFTPANGFIGNSATSATIRVTTSGDQYLPGVITFATEIYAPKIEQTKTVRDVNGGQVEQGDVLEYTVSGTNTGQDGTANFVLRDPIPANTTYVPGSIVLGGTSSTAGAATDATGDDRGEYDAANARVVARLGAGANATQGGNVAPGRTYSLTFRVRVNGPALQDDPVPAGTRIDNTATASFFSQTTNTPLGATSLGPQHRHRARPAHRQDAHRRPAGRRRRQHVPARRRQRRRRPHAGHRDGQRHAARRPHPDRRERHRLGLLDQRPGRHLHARRRAARRQRLPADHAVGRRRRRRQRRRLEHRDGLGRR
ncbi:DUF11 domain-containing protein [Conexibacter sp. W3-3-2]|nr:DUF11 domain-containing protein [Conexibacter sp. W3-3-2]